MKDAPALILTTLALMTGSLPAAEDIILRLRPDVTAPALTRITATEKVLLDAAPAGENSEWSQLELKVPFDGYVPVAALSKNFAIIEGTPVHALPDANSEAITSAKDGDLYEVKRVGDDWATVSYTKELTTYFLSGAAPANPVESAPEPMQLDPSPLPPVLELEPAGPTYIPQQNAPGFKPELGVGLTAPEELPPENVVWKRAPSSRAATPDPKPKINQPPSLPDGIIVSPGDTQARESSEKNIPEPEGPLRLLTGTLVREIDTVDPEYPIRLRSPDGRLIAYLDFSGIFIDDLTPYIDQRVFLRGHLTTVQPNSKDLVLHVRKIQLGY